MKKLSSLFKERRFKYGSLAVGLTVAFVALVIMINAVVYALAYSYGWYIDLTGTQYYGITSASENYLDMVLTPDVQIKIVFCQDKDEVLADSSGYYVCRCAETYKKAYPDNIKVEYLDVIAHPELASQYSLQIGTSLYTYNVIIESNKSTAFKIMTYENFYTFDSDSGDVYAFSGERKLTSTIVNLCTTDIPICYFTVGQGENIEWDTGYKCALYEMMEDAGFEVRTIDLETEDISPDARLIVINDPKTDLAAVEVDKISEFAGNDLGNVMVFVSPENQSELKNLEEWLEEWGIGIESGKLRDTSNSIDPDGFELVAYYPTDDTFGPSLHSSMRALQSAPKTIVPDAVAVKDIWKGEAVGYRLADSVIDTYSGSVLCAGDEELSGTYSLMMLSQQLKQDASTGKELINYVMVTSAGYASDEYIASGSYGNRNILFALSRAMGVVSVPMDIDFKVFSSERLSITALEARTWTIVMAAVIPVGILAAGGVVYFKRKRL